MTTELEQHINKVKMNKEIEMERLEQHINEVKQKLHDDNFEDSFEKGLYVKQLSMLEKDKIYAKTGKMKY